MCRLNYRWRAIGAIKVSEVGALSSRVLQKLYFVIFGAFAHLLYNTDFNKTKRGKANKIWQMKYNRGLITWPNQDDQKLIRIWPKNFHSDEPHFLKKPQKEAFTVASLLYKKKKIRQGN